MMDDYDDQFYKNLPFTLTQQQTKPNYVILGTGLQECLLAAHFSKLHSKPGLIIDIERTYGGSLKTVTLKQLISLTKKHLINRSYQFLTLPQFQQQNAKFFTSIAQNKAYKGYNIDIQPNFFFGSSVTCDLLKQADMDKYMDFRLVHSLVHYDGKSLKNVPLSKGKIFQSKDLGLLEKKLLLKNFHTLIQIYNRYMKVDQDLNSTKQFDKEFGNVDETIYQQFLKSQHEYFLPFLTNITKNNHKILNFIIYIISNYQYNYNNQLPEYIKNQYTLSSFIKRFGKFIKSCGIYGEGPYLYVDNGIGDVPQAFSRIASVYLSTYILHPKIEISKIQVQDQVKIYTNLYPSGYLQTKEVYYGPTLASLKLTDNTQFYEQYALRTILLCSKLGTEQQCPGLAYLLDLQPCQNPVYLFMFDSTSHSCPQKMILYQFETIIKDKTEQSYLNKIKMFVQTLQNVRGEKFQQSILFVTAYIRIRKYRKQVNTDTQINQKILKDSTGIDLDSYFNHFKSIVPEQKHYFKKQVTQHQDEQEDQHVDQTSMLIHKLQELNINKGKDDMEQQEGNKQQKNIQDIAKQQIKVNEAEQNRPSQQKAQEIQQQLDENPGNTKNVEQVAKIQKQESQQAHHSQQ